MKYRNILLLYCLLSLGLGSLVFPVSSSDVSSVHIKQSIDIFTLGTTLDQKEIEVDIYDISTTLASDCSFYNYDNKLFVVELSKEECNLSGRFVYIYLKIVFAGISEIRIDSEFIINAVGGLMLMVDDKITTLNSDHITAEGIFIPLTVGNHRISIIYATSDGHVVKYAFDSVSVFVTDQINEHSNLCAYCNDPFLGMTSINVNFNITLNNNEELVPLPITTHQVSNITGKNYYSRSEYQPSIIDKFDPNELILNNSSLDISIETQSIGFGGYQLNSTSSPISSLLLLIVESSYSVKFHQMYIGNNLLKLNLFTGYNRVNFLNIMPIGYWFSNESLPIAKFLDDPHDFEGLHPFGTVNTINGSFDFSLNKNKYDLLVPAYITDVIIEKDLGKFILIAEIVTLSFLVISVFLLRYLREGNK
ncbi:MAG: hypothetical protein HeimC2_28570 [Candidatus Heimdallarchaeota archaeon LC_2]|nr:MAG: hypothetical protein HeimC2_28570 [Candidatus Heimdallarchaeota archaeon LC_2]